MPGAVRSWADAHARFGRLPTADLLAPAIELAARRLPGVDALRRRRRADRAADRVDDRERRAVPARVPAVRPALAAGRARPQPARWRRPSRRSPSGGFEAFDLGDLGSRRARGLDAAGCPITVDDLRDHASTWTDPIAVDYRGVRVTTHPPNSSGIVALEILAILAQLEPPGPAAFGPDGVTDAGWIHAGIEAAKLAMADRDAHLTDPDSRDIPVARLLDPALRRRAGRADRPAPRRRPGPCHEPVGWRHGLPRGRRPRRQRGQPHPVDCTGRSGRASLDPDTGVLYQNRGSYFSLDPEHPNVLAPGKRTLHTLLPGMLFRDGVADAVGRRRGGRRRRPAAGPRPAGVGARRWRAGPARPPCRPRAGSSSRPRTSTPPVEVRLEPRHAAGIRAALEALGHPVTEVAPFDPLLGQEHAIELVDGGPAAPEGSLAGRHRPAQRRAAGGLVTGDR